jgi:methylphosphotriester-DNA--protein-cysteine methyltransferase
VSSTLIGADGRPYESSTPGTLGGHRRTKVYGHLDCPGALSLIRRGKNVVEHRVFFADEETAVAAGYRPCGTCMREEYRAWKRAAGASGGAPRASGG